MIDEKMITPDEALLRISASSLDQLLHPSLDPKGEKTLLAKGLPASPGGSTGQIVFSSEDAVAWAEKGKRQYWCESKRVPKTSKAWSKPKVC